MKQLIIGITLLLCACVFAAPADGGSSSSPVVEVSNSALQPVPRLQHYFSWSDNLGWLERHGKILVRNQMGPVDLVFVGDSITHAFDHGGNAVWERDFAQWNPVNMGFSGDRTQHVLWRIDNAALEGINPKVAVVMIGTNNISSNTPAEIAAGVIAVCEAIHSRLPETRVLLLAIFPRGEDVGRYPAPKGKVGETNAILAASDFPDWLVWKDVGATFLDERGAVDPGLMPDYLHPNSEGYERWSEAMLPELTRLMSDQLP